MAAVITTALMAAPLVSSNQAQPPLVSEPFADAIAPPAVAGPVAVSTSSAAAPVTTVAQATTTIGREAQRLVPSRRRLRVNTRIASLTATASPLPAESFGNMAYGRVVSASVLETPRKPLSRKLTGWLTGDGTHSVRPFPTISSDRP